MNIWMVIEEVNYEGYCLPNKVFASKELAKQYAEQLIETTNADYVTVEEYTVYTELPK